MQPGHAPNELGVAKAAAHKHHAAVQIADGCSRRGAPQGFQLEGRHPAASAATAAAAAAAASRAIPRQQQEVKIPQVVSKQEAGTVLIHPAKCLQGGWGQGALRGGR